VEQWAAGQDVTDAVDRCVSPRIVVEVIHVVSQCVIINPAVVQIAVDQHVVGQPVVIQIAVDQLVAVPAVISTYRYRPLLSSPLITSRGALFGLRLREAAVTSAALPQVSLHHAMMLVVGMVSANQWMETTAAENLCPCTVVGPSVAVECKEVVEFSLSVENQCIMAVKLNVAVENQCTEVVGYTLIVGNQCTGAVVEFSLVAEIQCTGVVGLSVDLVVNVKEVDHALCRGSNNHDQHMDYQELYDIDKSILEKESYEYRTSIIMESFIKYKIMHFY